MVVRKRVRMQQFHDPLMKDQIAYSHMQREFVAREYPGIMRQNQVFFDSVAEHKRNRPIKISDAPDY